jgi:hypothetical protein
MKEKVGVAQEKLGGQLIDKDGNVVVESTSIIKEKSKVTGVIRGQLIDPKTGKIVQEDVIENITTDVGEQMLALWTGGDIITKGYCSYMSLCDSSADPLETNTTEVGTNKGPRKAVSKTVVGNKITFEATWGTTEANYTIRRCYLFSAESAGNLFATGKFASPFAKTSDYSFKATYELTYE